MEYYEDLEKKSEKIQIIIIVLIFFLVGYILGCYAMNCEIEKNKENQIIENRMEAGYEQYYEQ